MQGVFPKVRKWLFGPNTNDSHTINPPPLTTYGCGEAFPSGDPCIHPLTWL
jgi:hypothetical protein